MVMEDRYEFTREDTGEIVEVDYATMIQHSRGWITLPDGVQAKRVSSGSKRWRAGENIGKQYGARAYVSDSLGFGQHQWEEFEKDRQAHGFSDVEFVRDPTCPEFYQVRCATAQARDRYAKHRGFDNKTGIGGVRFAPGELERAASMVKELYDVRPSE
jgi:hypothetical protein